MGISSNSSRFYNLTLLPERNKSNTSSNFVLCNINLHLHIAPVIFKLTPLTYILFRETLNVTVMSPSGNLEALKHSGIFPLWTKNCNHFL